MLHSLFDRLALAISPRYRSVLADFQEQSKELAAAQDRLQFISAPEHDAERVQFYRAVGSYKDVVVIATKGDNMRIMSTLPGGYHVLVAHLLWARRIAAANAKPHELPPAGMA